MLLVALLLYYWLIFFLIVCIYTTPVLLVLFLARRRIPRDVARWTLAVAFAAVAIYILVDSEFASSLYGMPQYQKLLVYVFAMGAGGAIGFFIGGTLTLVNSK